MEVKIWLIKLLLAEALKAAEPGPLRACAPLNQIIREAMTILKDVS